MKYFFYYFFIIITTNISAQTIKGIVANQKGELVSVANILVKNGDKKLLEYTFLEKGKYHVKLKKEYDKILITVKAYGYASKTYLIENPVKDKIYDVHFILEEITENIEEVVISSKRKPYSIKKDTIKYNVKSYSDGTERKIQEIIKKLPGVEVNEQSGEIKYKGKTVETVTLDGDNLFGYNYALGTKNINVDMVEQIEAIDNYTENPLLKGIEQGGKVSLNLKLKKGKLDVSGSLDIGTGLFNDGNQVFNLNSTVLGITKKYKSFANLAYNNIGINHSPFDYFGFNLNIEQQKEQDYFAEKIIHEPIFSNVLDEKRMNINNQFFGNYNAIFKLNTKLSVKTNLYLLQDKIKTNQLFETQYQIDNQEFETSDNTFISKKPKQYRGDVEVKYNTSNSSLLEYKFRIKQEDIETPMNVIQNQLNNYSSILNTNDFYLKQNLLWTKKLAERKAFQASLFHSFNDLSQIYVISPSIFENEIENDVQKSHFKKIFLEGKITYLGSNLKDKYAFTFGANFKSTPFESLLFNLEEVLSKNDFIFSRKNVFSTGLYDFISGKWKFSPSYSFRLLNQKLDQNTKNEQNNFIFEPTLKVKYKLNSNSFVTAKIGFNQTDNTERYFFLNQVLINNRVSIKNTPNLKLKKSEKYNLLYYKNDLYNQFQLNANVSYQKNRGEYFSNTNITENTTQIKYFFLPQESSNWNINFKVSKYIPILESTIKFTGNYSIANFRNIINDSELRSNKNQTLNKSLFWKTAFDIPINFENSFRWQYSNSQSENENAFMNNTYQNTSKIIIKPNKKWFVIMSSDYYLPNITQKKNSFLFLDATIRHRPKSKKWEGSFVVRNLTNESNFEQIQTSIVSTTVYKSDLLTRHFIVNLSWNF